MKRQKNGAGEEKRSSRLAMRLGLPWKGMDITGADKDLAQENAQAPRKKARAPSVGSIRWQPRRWALDCLVGHDGAVVKPRDRRGVIVLSCILAA
jgi:hypothetical protein